MATIQSALATGERFRPASDMDFLRYSKNLSWLLQCGHQEAQELLARFYGYEGVYDLRQAMKAPGVAGPFIDQVQAQDMGQRWDEWSQRDRLCRHRIIRRLLKWRLDTDRRELPNRYSLVTEIGLFCSPSAHRNLFKMAKELIAQVKDHEENNETNETNEAHVGVTLEGFPMGFRVAIEFEFHVNVKLAHDTELTTSPSQRSRIHRIDNFDSDPPSAKDILSIGQERLEADLFLNAARSLVSPLPDWLAVDFFEEDNPICELNTDLHILYGLFGDRIADGGPSPALEASFRRFAINPCERTAAECELLAGIDDPVQSLRHWRLGLRVRYAQYVTSDPDDYQSSFHVREAWHSRQFEVGKVTTYAACLLVDQGEYNVNFRFWRFYADVLVSRREDAPFEHAGRIEGFYVDPVGERYYSGTDDVIEGLEEDLGHADVAEAFKIVTSMYWPRIGIVDMKSWVNGTEDHAFALARVHIDPDMRPLVDEGLMVDTLSELLSGDACDWNGHYLANLLRNDGTIVIDGADYGDYDNEAWTYMSPVGIVVLQQGPAGTLGISIHEGEDDQKTTRMLKRDGEIVIGRSSRRHGWKPERNEGDDILDRLRQAESDVILFSPEVKDDEEDEASD